MANLIGIKAKNSLDPSILKQSRLAIGTKTTLAIVNRQSAILATKTKEV